MGHHSVDMRPSAVVRTPSAVRVLSSGGGGGWGGGQGGSFMPPDTPTLLGASTPHSFPPKPKILDRTLAVVRTPSAVLHIPQ